MNQSPVEDGVWFTQHITVQGKRIVVRVDGQVVTDYTEKPTDQRGPRRQGRWLSQGTFAIQGHDPGSRVRYRQIWVRPR